MIEATLKRPLRLECTEQGEGIGDKIRGLADLVIMFIFTIWEMKSQ